MEIIIRKEERKDYKSTEDVVEQAFRELAISDKTEHHLVSRLRNSGVFIPELSLIAEVEGKIVGHILLTKLAIRYEKGTYTSLALAPLSVLPSYQSKGIGSKLVREAIHIAGKLGFSSIIVLGYEDYYPKFGFQPASNWNIESPFEVPKEAFMGLELVEGGFHEGGGIVVYPKEFFE